MSKNDLKVAIVTGAGSGIGRATARAFAHKGIYTVAVDIDDGSGKETVQMIKNEGGTALFLKANVSNAVEVKAMIDRTIKEYGKLDYAFNNAGIAIPFTYTTDLSENDWDRVIAVNLKGVWLCMKYEIPEILKSGGVVVNMSSIAGVVGSARSLAYVAAKHGVVGITKTAALEYADKGVRINAVAPMPIDTPLIHSLFTSEGDNLDEVIDAKYPAKQLGTAAQIAEAVVWLCTDAPSLVNGHTLALDGGFTIQ